MSTLPNAAAAIPALRPQGDIDARRGVLIMIVGIALFSILNGMVKDEVRVFPVNQIVFFRNALALPALLAIVAATGGLSGLRTRHIFRHMTHGLTMTISIMAGFLGFRLLALAEANAISFLRPLIVTLLAAPLLGEKVSRASWIAVGLGFVGVIVMARPGAGPINEGMVYSLIGTFVGAINMLQQRRLSLTETTIGIVFWYMFLSSIVLLPTLFFSWVWPTPPQLLGLVVMGLASGLCQYVTIRPLYYASASTLAPVQYTSMIWAIVIGFIWFGDIPTMPVIIGSSIVLAATALVLHGGGGKKGCS